MRLLSPIYDAVTGVVIDVLTPYLSHLLSSAAQQLHIACWQHLTFACHLRRFRLLGDETGYH